MANHNPQATALAYVEDEGGSCTYQVSGNTSIDDVMKYTHALAFVYQLHIGDSTGRSDQCH